MGYPCTSLPAILGPVVQPTTKSFRQAYSTTPHRIDLSLSFVDKSFLKLNSKQNVQCEILKSVHFSIY